MAFNVKQKERSTNRLVTLIFMVIILCVVKAGYVWNLLKEGLFQGE